MKNLSAFWRKNRVLLIIFLSVLTLLLLVGRKYVSLNSDRLISGLSVNVTIEESATEAMNAYFKQQLTHGDPWEKVRLSQVTLKNFADVNLAYQENYYTLASIQSLNTNKEIDYILTDQLGLEALIKQQFFLDLRQFFTQEELNALDQRVICARSSEMAADAGIPIAIDITDLPFVQDNTATPDKLYFGIASNSTQFEALRLLWEYLNQ